MPNALTSKVSAYIRPCFGDAIGRSQKLWAFGMGSGGLFIISFNKKRSLEPKTMSPESSTDFEIYFTKKKTISSVYKFELFRGMNLHYLFTSGKISIKKERPVTFYSFTYL